MPLANDWVWGARWRMPVPDRDRAVLMPLKAYIDESGDGSRPTLVLAGWIGTPTQWARFSDEWDTLRRTYRFDVLHMDDAMKLNGEFHGWDESRRDECLVQAHRIIYSHTRSGVHYVLPLEPYRRLIQSDEDAPRNIKNPYYYAFFGLIKNMSNDWGFVEVDEPIDFIFDERVQEKSAIHEAWDSFVRDGVENRRYLGGTPIFDKDSRILPLQAADMAAWCARATWDANVNGAEPVRLPWSDKNIGESKLHGFIWNEARHEQHRRDRINQKARMISEFSLGVLPFGC